MSNLQENKNSIPDLDLIFFGSSELSVMFLERLKQHNILPRLIVTFPDKKAGRGLKLTANPVAQWATKHDIPFIKTDKLNSAFVQELKQKINLDKALFFVYAYGKFIPKKLLDLPAFGTLNYHPSLLPYLRGPSPVRTAILKNQPEALGSTIILLDEKMDHGPIIAQHPLDTTKWPLPGTEADKLLSEAGADLFAEILPDWISRKIKPQPQQHEKATYSHFFNKADAQIDLTQNPYENYLKILAFEGWPNAFFIHNGKRIKITQAEFKDGKLIIKTIIPEGKKQTPAKNYLPKTIFP